MRHDAVRLVSCYLLGLIACSVVCKCWLTEVGRKGRIREFASQYFKGLYFFVSVINLIFIFFGEGIQLGVLFRLNFPFSLSGWFLLLIGLLFELLSSLFISIIVKFMTDMVPFKFIFFFFYLSRLNSMVPCTGIETFLRFFVSLHLCNFRLLVIILQFNQPFVRSEGILIPGKNIIHWRLLLSRQILNTVNNLAVSFWRTCIHLK